MGDEGKIWMAFGFGLFLHVIFYGLRGGENAGGRERTDRVHQ